MRVQTLSKKPMTEQNILDEKNKILNEALKIIDEDNFSGLSMRKLASRLGITATTIYNYFASKDEIYLIVLTKGFEDLYSRLNECYQARDNSRICLRAMIDAYIKFGIEEPNYYNIMFTYNVPKYDVYLDKKECNVAMEERKMALKSLQLVNSLISEILNEFPEQKEKKAYLYTLEFWCGLHGLVSLYNSMVMQTVEDDFEILKSDFVDHFFEIIFPKTCDSPNR
jgi:AcrR family transcriptional regulator